MLGTQPEMTMKGNKQTTKATNISNPDFIFGLMLFYNFPQ